MTGNINLRLGLIGTGQMAAHYAHSWVSMPEVAFVALSDVNAVSRRNFVDICRGAGRPEPREFDDFRSMLTTCRDELDAVYVCTPHSLHAEQGIAVVESGFDLLIEKPMVTTVAEAERLIAARDQSGRRTTPRMRKPQYAVGFASLVPDIFYCNFNDLRNINNVSP